MTSDLNWWNSLLDLLVAVGTIGAVVVALFGQAFRAKFFPPKLALCLRDAGGEATTARDAAGREEGVRYWHLVVTNSRRWSPANDVQVVLLQVEEPGPSGEDQVRWRGDVPFGWRHQHLFPLTRTIGAHADIDLCSVTESRRLQLHLLLEPLNLQAVRTARSTLVLSIQARGHRGVSHDSLTYRAESL